MKISVKRCGCNKTSPTVSSHAKHRHVLANERKYVNLVPRCSYRELFSNAYLGEATENMVLTLDYCRQLESCIAYFRIVATHVDTCYNSKITTAP